MHDNFEGMFKPAGPPGDHHTRKSVLIRENLWLNISLTSFPARS